MWGDFLKEILVDIETYSEVDIGKCGLYRYATDSSFEILLVAWATDEGDGFGETRCADLASGEPLPEELLEDFQSGNVRLIHWNGSAVDSFETKSTKAAAYDKKPQRSHNQHRFGVGRGRGVLRKRLFGGKGRRHNTYKGAG